VRWTSAQEEATQLRREMIKLERSLGGIKLMEALPELVVIDVGHEHIAIHEARSSASRLWPWSIPLLA